MVAESPPIAVSARNVRSERETRAQQRARLRRQRPSRRPWWWRLLQIVLLAYLLVVLWMVYREPFLVYPGAFGPSAASPPRAVPPAELITYRSSSNIELAGQWIERGGAENIVVFCHGNAERAEDLVPSMRRLSELADASVLIVEYRGFADSQTPNERGIIVDATAAVQTLCERFDLDASELTIYGRSLGGGVASAIAERFQCRELILERTFDSAVAVAADRFWWLPVRLLMKNRFDTAARLTNYHGRLMVVHGTKDDVIPIEHARRMIEQAASEDITFRELPSWGHLDAVPPELISEIAAWIRQGDREEAHSNEATGANFRGVGDDRHAGLPNRAGML